MLTALGLVIFYATFSWGLVSYLLTFTRHAHELPPRAPGILDGPLTLSSDTAGMV